MSEVWKPIKGYEGIYEVSSYGRVRSVERIANFIRMANGEFALEDGNIDYKEDFFGKWTIL